MSCRHNDLFCLMTCDSIFADRDQIVNNRVITSTIEMCMCIDINIYLNGISVWQQGQQVGDNMPPIMNYLFLLHYDEKSSLQKLLEKDGRHL